MDTSVFNSMDKKPFSSEVIILIEKNGLEVVVLTATDDGAWATKIERFGQAKSEPWEEVVRKYVGWKYYHTRFYVGAEIVKITWSGKRQEDINFPSFWDAKINDVELEISQYPSKRQGYGWTIKIMGITHRYSDDNEFLSSLDEAKEAVMGYYNKYLSRGPIVEGA